MSDLVAYFNDPLDPARSLQLNNRYWRDETFQHLDLLREADYDVNNFRLASLKKSLKHVKLLVPPPQVRGAFLSRLVYSMMYSVSFEPIRFSLKLSDGFVRANLYNGPEDQFETSAQRTEELKYIVDLVHCIYRDHYGIDVLSSAFAVRYMRSNAKAVRRMTEHGACSDFHFDEGKDFTCIIYLSAVGRDNGCFTYIGGSNAVRKSHVLRALHQVVDNDLQLSTPEQRAHLPLEVRGSLRMGTYLDDEKRDWVRSAAVDVVGNSGDGIIFNGFDTIHRGGQPMVGERTALFISTRGHLNMRIKKAAYERLASLWL